MHVPWRMLTAGLANARRELALHRVSGVVVLRFAVALLVAPARGVAQCVLFLVLWQGGLNIFGWAQLNDSGAVHIAVTQAVAVAILGTLVTGIAALVFVWMATRGPLSFRRVLLLGIVLGNLPFALIIITIVVAQLVQGISYQTLHDTGMEPGSLNEVRGGCPSTPSACSLAGAPSVRPTNRASAARIARTADSRSMLTSSDELLDPPRSPRSVSKPSPVNRGRKVDLPALNCLHI
jgi:hypothetical protein